MAAETKTTKTPTETAQPAPQSGGMGAEQYAALLASIERRKINPGYFELWEEEVAEFRKQVQEQAERERDEEKNK